MLSTYVSATAGETATSLLEATAFATGSAAARHLSARCYRRCAPLVGTLPSRAKAFCDATEQAYGTPEEVVSKFSLAPLYSRGMNPLMQRKLVAQLVDGSHSRTCCPRLRPFIQCGNRHGLQCPECAMLATKMHGRRISYCMHCIDFVSRCPIHGCKLVSDDDCSSLEEMLASNAGVNAARNATRYAQLAHAMAQGCSSEYTRESVRRRLREKQYLSESGRCRLDSLRSAFAGAFSDGFEDIRLNELLTNTDVAATSAYLLNREARAIHPVFLILLEWLSVELDTLPIRSHAMSPDISNAEPAMDVRDAKRTAWLQHQMQCAGMGRNEIRRRQPALWVWLYRYDRDWLVSHQVAPRQPRGRKAHAIPSESFARTIVSAERSVHRSAIGREPLPSAYQMRLAYGMNQYLFDRATEAFDGAGKAAQLPARREVFIARRLARAISVLASKGMATDAASLAREARLRISTVVRYQREESAGYASE